MPALRSTDYINTIPPEREPWFPGDEEIERRIRAFIRWNAAVMVSERQPQGPRGRRPHRDVPVVGQPLRGRLQPLLPRQGPPRRRRPDLHPGPRLPRHLRPRLPRGPADRGAALPLPPGGPARRRQGPAVVPPPAADAGLLGVPDGLDGPHRASTRSTRPGSTATCTTAASRTPSQQHVWAFLGDGEMAEPESLGAIRVAAREELDNLTWVINCNLQQLDGPVHRQRQDHPGARGQLPRRRLERHQGGLGPRVGRAARPRRRRRPGQPDEHHPRRRVPDLLGRGRRLHPRALLRRRPAAAQDGRAHDRPSRSRSCRAAATTTARCTPPSTPPPSTSASRR